MRLVRVIHNFIEKEEHYVHSLDTVKESVILPFKTTKPFAVRFGVDEFIDDVFGVIPILRECNRRLIEAMHIRRREEDSLRSIGGIAFEAVIDFMSPYPAYSGYHLIAERRLKDDIDNNPDIRIFSEVHSRQASDIGIPRIRRTMVLCAEEESHLVDDGDQGAPSSAKWLKLVSLHLYYSFGLGRFTYQAFACYDLLNGGQQKLDEYGVWTGDKEQPAADSCTFDVLPASTVSVWTHKGSVKLTSTLVSTLSAAPINPALFSYATNPALSCLMLPIRLSNARDHPPSRAFITHIAITITLESLLTNLVTVDFDYTTLSVQNSSSSSSNLTVVSMARHRTANSGPIPNGLLVQGAMNFLEIIPLGVLDVSAAATLHAVPTTYNLALTASALKEKAKMIQATSSLSSSVIAEFVVKPCDPFAPLFCNSSVPDTIYP
ncbi:hypothetical protein J132_01318 [Termitomyces sp. J132]|nr:hypothetical protein J132_01318 [Termitomyces sp. J132]